MLRAKKSKMYDVIIVGGGVAGATAGRSAGQLGLDALLIDKDKFPREKVCGGLLSKSALDCMQLDLPDDVIDDEINTLRVFSDGGYYNKVLDFVEVRSDEKIATSVSRLLFDDFLLKKAKDLGIHVIEGERILDFKLHKDYVVVFGRNACYRAKFLVVAEGCDGLLSSSIRRTQFNKNNYGVCVVSEVENEPSFMKNTLEVHFGVVKNGYGWRIPHKTYTSVGVGALTEDMKDYQNVMKNFLGVLEIKTNNTFKGAYIPFKQTKNNVVGSRILFVGDSAGFVDSFSGEGIYYAMASGKIAVEEIKNTITLGDTKYLNYVKKCEQTFGEDLKYSNWLFKLVNSYPELSYRLFAKKEVVEKYVDVCLRKISYKNFMMWLIPRIPVLIK